MALIRSLLLLFCCWAATAQALISLKDDAGRTLTLAAPAQRIVSLAPHITDMLLALGARAQIVGVIDDHETAGAHAQSLTGFPVVAGVQGINEERLAALKPDVVLVWQSGVPAPRARRLEAQGYKVFYIEPATLDGIADNMLALGRLTGHDSIGRKQADSVRRELSALRQDFQSGRRLRAFYQVWLQPLYSLQGKHLVNQGLALCGADSIVPAGPLAAPLVNLEFVLAAQPEVIFFGKTEAAASRAFWQRFSRMPAVANQHLLAVDSDAMARPGPELVRALRPLCETLSPWRR